MKSLFFNLFFSIFCSVMTVSANTGGPSDGNINDSKNTYEINAASNTSTATDTVNLNFKVIKRGGQVDFFWATPFVGAAQGFVVQFSEDGKMKTNLTPTATEEEFPYSFDGYQIVQKGENEVVYKLDSLTESVMAVSMVIQKFPFHLVLNKSIAEPDTTAVE